MRGLLSSAVTAMVLLVAGAARASDGLTDSSCPRWDVNPIETAATVS